MAERPDGMRICFTPIPLRDTDGRVIGGINMFMENDRAQAGGSCAARERDALRTLADHAPVLIWINGPAGCEFVNRTYLDFLGVTMADVQGMAGPSMFTPMTTSAMSPATSRRRKNAPSSTASFGSAVRTLCTAR